MINQVIWFVPWQTVHFFGFSLIFGTALAVCLRVLGVWKSMLVLRRAPAAAARRLRGGDERLQRHADHAGRFPPLSDRGDLPPKIAFIVIGAVAVLYFSVSEKLWNVKAGEDAPMSAKWVAAMVLLSWAGVIMGGRLIPYV